MGQGPRRDKRSSEPARVKKGTPLSNLQLALLQKLDVPAETFGDSTGSVLNTCLSSPCDTHSRPNPSCSSRVIASRIGVRPILELADSICSERMSPGLSRSVTICSSITR